MDKIQLSVSDFIALTNQTLEYAYSSIEVVGEVASFKVNQGKFVFFDIKDSESSVGCFMMVFQLRTPLEDGMKVVVTATPRLTKWGKFSLTVQAVRPVGEGSLKRSFELLKAKLESEGLFDAARKRPLPEIPKIIGVITSTQAAGYGDFVKILGERWGGLEILVAHTQVQGDIAADQMIRALEYFQTRPELPEVLVLIRGGGSADDLAAYNDEKLVRAIASSRIPTLVGVGHEVDISLADLVADRRAATPSNAAQILVPDKREIIAENRNGLRVMVKQIDQTINRYYTEIADELIAMLDHSSDFVQHQQTDLAAAARSLAAFDPRRVLARGYAVVRGTVKIGQDISIETAKMEITAEVKDVRTY
jgi:exodeoxyribonuclease VII large subunit